MKYLIIFVIMTTLLSSCSTSKEFSSEIIVVPDDYQGHVYIFYNQDYLKGEVKKEKSEVIIFIPEDGIVFTKYIPKSTITYKSIYRTEYEKGGDKENVEGLDGGLIRIYDPKEMLCSHHYIGNYEGKNIDSLMHYGKIHEYIKAVYLKYYKKGNASDTDNSK